MVNAVLTKNVLLLIIPSVYNKEDFLKTSLKWIY